MANTKNNSQDGSMGSNGSDQDRQFEGQGSDMGYGKGEGQQTGATEQETSSQDGDEMTTAGGRQGNFSDSDRGSQGQWSPSSSRSSEE
ncbi:MAG TPA: hypothetical protein VNA22_02670 [Pyrinomonadaceae bacterium]|nr:hypothetical protein [Pyrinomonadaceae bacterium]